MASGVRLHQLHLVRSFGAATPARTQALQRRRGMALSWSLSTAVSSSGELSAGRKAFDGGEPSVGDQDVVVVVVVVVVVFMIVVSSKVLQSSQTESPQARQWCL